MCLCLLFGGFLSRLCHCRSGAHQDSVTTASRLALLRRATKIGADKIYGARQSPGFYSSFLFLNDTSMLLAEKTIKLTNKLIFPWKVCKMKNFFFDARKILDVDEHEYDMIKMKKGKMFCYNLNGNFDSNFFIFFNVFKYVWHVFLISCCAMMVKGEKHRIWVLNI